MYVRRISQLWQKANIRIQWTGKKKKKKKKEKQRKKVQ